MAAPRDHDLLDFVQGRRYRLLTQYEESGGCWLWTGPLAAHGYGQISVTSRRTMRAHRAFWMLHHGRPVPEGMTLDHLCMVKRCVNPEHLEPAPLGQNIHRARLNAGIGANIRVRPGKKRTGYAVLYRELVDGKNTQRSRTFHTLEDAEAFRAEIIGTRRHAWAA